MRLTLLASAALHESSLHISSGEEGRDFPLPPVAVETAASVACWGAIASAGNRCVPVHALFNVFMLRGGERVAGCTPLRCVKNTAAVSHCLKVLMHRMVFVTSPKRHALEADYSHYLTSHVLIRKLTSVHVPRETVLHCYTLFWRQEVEV
jgi:hypothetical protein